MECSTQSDTKFDLEGWSIDHTAGRPILMHNNCSVIEAEQAYGLLGLINAAAQPQREPVAVVIATGGPHDSEDRVLAELQAELPPVGTKLYAEPPAPVAVVMPERMGHSTRGNGWNACLDEVTRLNTKE